MKRKILLVTVLFLSLTASAAFLVRTGMHRNDFLGNKADAIIVLAGPTNEDRERLEAGVRLVERGAGDYLILPLRNRALSWSTLQKIYGIHSAVPDERVLLGRPEQVDSAVLRYCGGTFSEAALTMDLMRAHSLSSAVVVSSRYHIPRARLAFQNLNNRCLLSFSYQSVGEPDTGKLLLSARALAKRGIEYGKFMTAFLVYPLGARVVNQDNPD